MKKILSLLAASLALTAFAGLALATEWPTVAPAAKKNQTQIIVAKVEAVPAVVIATTSPAVAGQVIAHKKTVAPALAFSSSCAAGGNTKILSASATLSGGKRASPAMAQSIGITFAKSSSLSPAMAQISRPNGEGSPSFAKTDFLPRPKGISFSAKTDHEREREKSFQTAYDKRFGILILAG